MKWATGLLVLIATATAYAQCTADRPELTRTLLDAKVIDADRVLAHCSHTCDLKFAGDTYHVLDIRELVKNASVARGVNQIVILDSAWKVAKRIPYVEERPLFCRNDQIVVSGKLHIPESTGEPGNVIVFRGAELDVEFRNLKLVSLPSLGEQEAPKKKAAPARKK